MQRFCNVIQFSCFNAPYKGNFIYSLLKLEDTLAAKGIRTIYLFEKETAGRQWIGELQQCGATIYFLSGNILRDFIQMRLIIRRHKIGIIHTHFTGVRYHGLFNLVRSLSLTRLYLISHLHRHYEKKTTVKRLLIHMMSRIDLFIGCGQSAAEHFKLINNIKDDRITFVNNAIDFSRLSLVEDIDVKCMCESKSTKKILMFGNYFYVKGVDIALEAIRSLVDEGCEVCLLISVSTNKEVILNQIAARFNGIPKWVQILDARNDVASYYNISDVFISPSRTEGMCYSLIEAAFCRVPLVASDIPGQSGLNLPSVFKFTSEDSLELRQQIISALTLSEMDRNKLTDMGKSFVLEHYDISAWAIKIAEIYQRYYFKRLQTNKFVTEAA